MLGSSVDHQGPVALLYKNRPQTEETDANTTICVVPDVDAYDTCSKHLDSANLTVRDEGKEMSSSGFGIGRFGSAMTPY